MAKLLKHRRLADAYTFAGFRPLEHVEGMFGDPRARLVKLVRRGKKRSAASAGRRITRGTTVDSAGSAICPAPTTGFTSIWRCGGSTAESAAR